MIRYLFRLFLFLVRFRIPLNCLDIDKIKFLKNQQIHPQKEYPWYLWLLYTHTQSLSVPQTSCPVYDHVLLSISRGSRKFFQFYSCAINLIDYKADETERQARLYRRFGDNMYIKYQHKTWLCSYTCHFIIGHICLLIFPVCVFATTRGCILAKNSRTLAKLAMESYRLLTDLTWRVYRRIFYAFFPGAVLCFIGAFTVYTYTGL